jgi:hypothetical protein
VGVLLLSQKGVLLWQQGSMYVNADSSCWDAGARQGRLLSLHTAAVAAGGVQYRQELAGLMPGNAKVWCT